MNDGDRESARDSETSVKKSRQSSGDEFGRAVSKIAVAQICQAAGFHSAHHSALDALGGVMLRYIVALGRNAKFYANVAGRTSCNVFDIVQGLEDLSSPVGFSNASDAHHCPTRSGVLREVANFIALGEEVPFARHIPSFPIARVSRTGPSFAQDGEVTPGSHIPDWLPKFPDPLTYSQTPISRERIGDAKEIEVQQGGQQRKAERTLLSLQERLARNDGAGFAPIVDSDAGNKKQVVNRNPFLVPPLPYGDRQVSEIVVPGEAAGEKRRSVFETFTPAIEAAKGENNGSNKDDKKALTKNRSTVHFKIGIERKPLAISVFPNALNDEKESWWKGEPEKDEKKRRAELILKEAMEKPHDLVQL